MLLEALRLILPWAVEEAVMLLLLLQQLLMSCWWIICNRCNAPTFFFACCWAQSRR